jgi:hypothetical protein
MIKAFRRKLRREKCMSIMSYDLLDSVYRITSHKRKSGAE